MKVIKGDKVLIIQGKDRGKTGEVLAVNYNTGHIIVHGINLAKKHVRSKQQNQKGQRVEIERPLDISNVKVICPKCSKASVIKYKVIIKSDNKRNKIRICKKCQQEI